MVQIPVYAFTGFLESGKTKFIQETLEDPRFNAGERTLILLFEEGEEEYDLSTYPYKNVYIETLDQESVTPKELRALQKKHKAQRIVAELNGMHSSDLCVCAQSLSHVLFFDLMDCSPHQSSLSTEFSRQEY